MKPSRSLVLANLTTSVTMRIRLLHAVGDVGAMV